MQLSWASAMLGYLHVSVANIAPCSTPTYRLSIGPLNSIDDIQRFLSNIPKSLQTRLDQHKSLVVAPRSELFRIINAEDSDIHSQIRAKAPRADLLESQYTMSDRSAS